MNARHARFASATSGTVLSVALASGAWAQSQPTPPEHYTLDPRGVDLVTGDLSLPTTDVVIGQPGQGGLVFGRTYFSQGLAWRDRTAGTLYFGDTEIVAAFGPVSERFVQDGLTWVSAEGNGSTLDLSVFGEATVIDARGFRLVFSTYYDGMLSAYGSEVALVESLTTPGGETTEYHYLVACSQGGGTPPCSLGNPPIVRVQSITNNRGYQLKFTYFSDDPTNNTAWLRTQQVIGVNNAVDPCDPMANACPTFSRTWPSMTYSNQANPLTTTDQSGRTVTYAYGGSSGRLSGVRAPGSTSDDLSISYLSDAKVSQVVGASGTWTYAYSDVGTTRTTVASGPLDQELTVVADLTAGRATSVTDALSNTTAYQYDGDGRLTRMTQPEGNYVQLTYDSRGNVTQTQAVSKDGLDTITTTATYPTTCSNPVTCNLPSSTTDALGRSTDYVYDSSHGGVTSITLPAPDTGQPRPQTRVSYAAQTAYYKNSSGTIVAAASSVTLPTQVSACATADATTGCSGTADEIKTVTTYGATGVANNLLPTQVARGSGTSPNMAVTAMTYTPNGDVETVDGPLSGSGDQVQYRYDDARQTIGVVGPDPDGGGARLNRAQRMTYNTRGQITLAEQGTTAGYTNTDWANFTTLQKVAQGYDSWGRPVRSEIQAANGSVYGLTQVSYDAAGRPECQAVRMNPAVFGTVTTNACALGAEAGFGPDRIVRTVYDPLNRPQSTTSAYGVTGEAITETVDYTSNGLPEVLIDGDGNTSIVEYDGFDRPLKLRYPNATGGGTSTTDFDAWTYDDASNVLTMNRRGVTITYEYDRLNRPVEVSAPSVPLRNYAYDNLGRMTTASSDAQVWQTFQWDALSRRTGEHWGASGWMLSTYDAAGRRTKLTWPDNWYVDYDWDLYGGLLAVRENGATSGAGVLATYAYDDLGRRTSASLGNGTSTTYGWDAVSRLASLSFNPAGTTDDLAMTYAYDPAGGIVQRTLSDGDYAYAPTTGATAYANDGLNRVTSAGGTAVTYDGQENAVTAPGTPTLDFDGLNQMMSAGATRLWYEPLGRLYQTYDTATSSQYRYFAYDGQQRVTEYDGQSSTPLIRRHVPGAGLDDVVATVEANGSRSWLTADERGSVMALSNASGAVTQTNAWDEYGVPRSGNAGTFQYTGQVWLGFANLQHSRARAYDPTLGRFRQTDPIGYSDGANLYAYVRANPVSFSDPLGTQCWTLRTWTDTYRGVFDDSGRLVGWKLDGSVLKSERLVCDTETQYEMFMTFAANAGGLGSATCPTRPQGIGMQFGGFGQGLGDAFTFGLYSDLWAAIPGELGDMYEMQTETEGYKVGLYGGTGVSVYRLLYAGGAQTLSLLNGRSAVNARNQLKGVMSFRGSAHSRIRSYEQMLERYGSDRGVALAASRTNPRLTGAAILGAASGGSQALACL